MILKAKWMLVIVITQVNFVPIVVATTIIDVVLARP